MSKAMRHRTTKSLKRPCALRGKIRSRSVTMCIEVIGLSLDYLGQLSGPMESCG